MEKWSVNKYIGLAKNELKGKVNRRVTKKNIIGFIFAILGYIQIVALCVFYMMQPGEIKEGVEFKNEIATPIICIVFFNILIGLYIKYMIEVSRFNPKPETKEKLRGIFAGIVAFIIITAVYAFLAWVVFIGQFFEPHGPGYDNTVNWILMGILTFIYIFILMATFSKGKNKNDGHK